MNTIDLIGEDPQHVDKVQALHEKLWEILRSESMQVGGPAVQVTLTRMIAVAGGYYDPATIQAIQDDLSNLIQKWRMKH
jgi:hypothetical protein